jgi:hypothetical protein
MAEINMMPNDHYVSEQEFPEDVDAVLDADDGPDNEDDDE